MCQLTMHITLVNKLNKLATQQILLNSSSNDNIPYKSFPIYWPIGGYKYFVGHPPDNMAKPLEDSGKHTDTK